MADIETVVNGLNDIGGFIAGRIGIEQARNFLRTIDDAIDMLKEQEAVEPILEQDSMVCGVCGHEVIWQKMIGDGIWVDEELDYCPHCGKSVKWE